MTPYLNRLVCAEEGHNIWFQWEIRKPIPQWSSNTPLLISRSLINLISTRASRTVTHRILFISQWKLIVLISVLYSHNQHPYICITLDRRCYDAGSCAVCLYSNLLLLNDKRPNIKSAIKLLFCREWPKNGFRSHVISLIQYQST